MWGAAGQRQRQRQGRCRVQARCDQKKTPRRFAQGLAEDETVATPAGSYFYHCMNHHQSEV
jgi:hypothetical protein